MSLEMFFDDVIIQPQRMKICIKCKTPKSATTEYFHRQASNRGGFIGICKECKSEFDIARM